MLCGVVRLIANHLSSTSSKARLKQGSFPPPALPGFIGTVTLSDSHRDRYAASNGSPTLPASPLRRAVPTTPADRTGASVDLLPHSCCLPRSRRVGIRDCTFEACSGFTLVRPIASLGHLTRPLSRGFDAAGCPASPLVSFRSHRLFSEWNPPPQVIRAFVAHRDARGPEEHERRATGVARPQQRRASIASETALTAPTRLQRHGEREPLPVGPVPVAVVLLHQHLEHAPRQLGVLMQPVERQTRAD